MEVCSAAGRCGVGTRFSGLKPESNLPQKQISHTVAWIQETVSDFSTEELKFPTPFLFIFSSI